MSDTGGGGSIQQNVQTILKVVDQSSGALASIHHAAEKVHGVFEKIEHVAGHLLPTLGGLGIVFSLHNAKEATEKYLKNLKEVHELTEATASETDLIFSSARKSGVEYETMKSVMFSLSRRGSMMEQSMAVMNGVHVPGMAKRMQHLGVNIEKGPVVALSQMAEAVKKGKVHTSDLMSQFRVPPGSVNDFKKFLSTLDTKKLAGAKKGGLGLMTSEDLESFDAMEDAQHRIADAWNRVQVLVGVKLMPVLTRLTEKIADKVESWLPAAQRFGTFLADHMELILSLATKFVKVMAAAKVASMVGSVPLVQKGVGMLAERMMQSVAAGMAFGGLGPAAAAWGALKAAIVTFGPVVLAVAAAVGALYLGFKAVQNNVGGVRDRIMEFWDSIQARFTLIGEALGKMWEAVEGIFGGKGTFGDFIGSLVASGFEKAVGAMDFAVHVLQTVLSMGGELGDMMGYIWRDVIAGGIKEYVVDPVVKFFGHLKDLAKTVADFFVDQYNLIVGFWGGKKVAKSTADSFKMDLGWLQEPIAMWKKHWNKTQVETVAQVKKAREATERVVPEHKTPAVYNDFRGSRFDITQSFAEGFDPDRVAVAFATDVAQMGENKVQSGFAPVFSTR